MNERIDKHQLGESETVRALISKKAAEWREIAKNVRTDDPSAYGTGQSMKKKLVSHD